MPFSKSKWSLILAAVACLALVFLTTILALSARREAKIQLGNQNQNNQQSDTLIKLKFSSLELADDENEREQGLMNRQSLCTDCGMLFEFESETVLNFWMKDTYISLDIIFLTESGQITDIHENTKTLQTETTYASTKPAKYVLEANAGYAKANNLQTGQTLDLTFLRQQLSQFQFSPSQSSQKSS